MRDNRKPLSVSHKFFILLLLFSFIIIFDALILLRRTKGTELYDDLSRRLNVLMTDIVRLEYVLDIAVVTKNFEFEDKRGQTINSDVKALEQDVNVLRDPAYLNLFERGSQFSGIRNSVLDNWQTIRKEISRLDNARTEEELLLVHNAVDMNTFILSENVQRIITTVKNEKDSAFRGGRNMILYVFIFSLALMLAAGFVFYGRNIFPFKILSSSLDYTLGADIGARVRENIPGDAGHLASAINRVLDRVEGFYSGIEKREKQARLELGNTARKIEALNTVTSMVGRSLSQYEISLRAAGEVILTLGADCGALYLIEEGRLKLKVSKGFSGTFFYKGEEVPLSERLREGRISEKPIVFASMEEYPAGRFKETLMSEGVKSLAVIPVLHEDAVSGFFEVAFRERRDIRGEDLLFLQAISSNVGVAVSYSDVFTKEHAARIFMERIIQQSPFGLAVFDRDGVCTLANTAFKRYLGCDQRSDFVGSYRIFDDKEFARQGVIPAIKKSYEGHIVGFVAEYTDPFAREVKHKKFRVKSAPIYDAVGNIPNIIISLDDITPNSHNQPLTTEYHG